MGKIFETISYCLSLFAIIISVIVLCRPSQKEDKQERQPVEVVKYGPDLLSSIEWIYLLGEEKLNEDRAVYLMNRLGIEHPHIVFAQMRLESGNFRSNIATTNNNFFGMYHPRQRVTTSKGNNNGYAVYENWALSIVDYGLWQRMYARGLTEDEYYSLLEEKYAEDKEYVMKVKSIAGEVKLCQEILEYQKK